MTYVDGFVMPVPKKNIAAYKKMAAWGKKIWTKHGAIDYKECVGDDLKGMKGCLSFPKMAKAKADQTVFFSFIVFKSKAHRDAVNKAVMKEMETMKMPKNMPFDPKHMAYGGFKTIVE